MSKDDMLNVVLLMLGHKKMLSRDFSHFD